MKTRDLKHGTGTSGRVPPNVLALITPKPVPMVRSPHNPAGGVLALVREEGDHVLKELQE